MYNNILKTSAITFCLGLFLAGGPTVFADQSSGAVTTADYARAERFLSANTDKMIANGSVKHHWIGRTDTFWYKRDGKDGKEYVFVDAATGSKKTAFNHSAVARMASKASGVDVAARDLDVKAFSPIRGGAVITLAAAKNQWQCNTVKNTCEEHAPPALIPGDMPSPDGRWAVFAKEHNLFLRSLSDGSVKQLTDDGEEHYSYGAIAGNSTSSVSMRRMGVPIPPVVLWSSDSKRFVTQKLDERKVKDLHLLQSAPETGSARPVLHSYRYSMPGDEHVAQAELSIFNVAKGTETKVKHDGLDVIYMSPLTTGRVWWSDDNTQVYMVPTPLYFKTQQLLKVDAASGDVVTVVEEQGETFIEAASSILALSIKTLPNGNVIWYSERDGWGHLYHYDKTGRLLNQITKGKWQVGEIISIDAEQQKIVFTARGKEKGLDPYFTHLYSVSLDGSDFKKLTAGNANHEVTTYQDSFMTKLRPGAASPSEVSFSPTGNYFVETYSAPNMPPVTVLRTVDGDIVSEIERADISELEKLNFTMPEPFSVLAADGKTVIYGNILRPSNFDPTKKYPVLDSIYPGPQIFRAAKSFKGAVFGMFGDQPLAELGFIVVSIDGRGTPGRSKAFHDVSYGDLGQAGNLEDHIAGLKQLAEKYPYMDLDRVGIFGHSGGGFASTRAIFDYPDFYKVAVSSAGNHDQRGYVALWGATYQGPFSEESYANAVNANVAKNLKGKLLLVHGDMDDNVHPALTMQVVDALVKANKDFDMLLLPNQAHGFTGAAGAYFTRKKWDYFVKHLKGATPPAGYIMSGMNIEPQS